MITFVFSSTPSFRALTRSVTAGMTKRSSPIVAWVPTRESTDSNSASRDSTVSLGDFFHFGNLGIAEGRCFIVSKDQITEACMYRSRMRERDGRAVLR